VKVNVPIAVLETEGGEPAPQDIPATMEAIRAALAPASPPAQKTPSPAPAVPPAPRSGNGAAAPHTEQRLFASPLAKRIAERAGIDIASVHGSGPRGRIVKADVEAAAKGGVPKPAAPREGQTPAKPLAAAEAHAVSAGLAPLPDARLFYREGEYEAVPNDSMRKAIARRLTSAKSLIPHYYLTIDCDIGALMALRARLNEKSPKAEGAYKLSINDFVIKAAAMALMKHPDVNASWTDAAILKHKHADIGIAVDLNPGLITPIVFEAEAKGLIEISNEVKSLAERAKAKKLKPQEYEGGAFSISNLGMFGIKEFTAIINPPQSAILAVGAGEERAVIRDGKVIAATIMSVTMSCDHRIIDGATGARYLQTLKIYIEEPASMLL
jgi:pyruvate dehydrogenase E2 component (dihydrolipoamide acetyltransferase)